MSEDEVRAILRRMVKAKLLSDGFKHGEGRPHAGRWYVGREAPAVSWDYALGYATAAKTLLK